MNKIKISELKKNLHNHSEDIVLELMQDLLTKDYPETCTCKQCLLDISSYTLNRLPAKYIASKKGNLHAKISEFEQQYQVNIITHLTKAIKIVNENPAPDCERSKKSNP